MVPDDWVAELGSALPRSASTTSCPAVSPLVIDVHSRPRTPTCTATWRVLPPSSTVTKCWLPTVLIADVGTASPDTLCSVTMVTVPVLPLLTTPSASSSAIVTR